MLLSALQKSAIASLSELYPASEARSIVLMLCSSLFGTGSYTGIVDPGYEIPDTKEFDKAMERLLKGEPIQYVLGRCEFFSYTFNVNPSVLIPRPETELLCREAVNVLGRLQRMRGAYGKSAVPLRVVDFCTGSGCLAWSLALSVPGVRVVATDISEEALAVASGQPFKALLKEKGAVAPQFVKADLLDPSQLPEGPFDMIVSNPPYIMEEERSIMHSNVLDWEPSIAVFAPAENPLVFYRAIAGAAGRLLHEGGGGMVEINAALARDTLEVFKAAGLKGCEIRKDLSEKPRFIAWRV
ncbi:MAG: peptide chain release factor N(5)-glutamine methyltransferase [Bacteroidales bacterium]|nr:peptide chain release factor N(5)-glutamine methyltransferase [Bacteroidales bacterium]